MMTTTEPQAGTVRLAAMIALEPTAKMKAERSVTLNHRMLSAGVGTGSPLMGISRTYRPIDENDPEQLPPEESRVQVFADQVLDEIAKTLADILDVVATREFGNATVKSDLKVGDVVIAREVPPGFCLYLDKQLEDLNTIIRSLPILPPEEEWSWDPATGAYRTPVRQTHRSKKLPVAFTKAPATDKHAAQVEVVYEDKMVGIWSRTNFSGAFPADRVKVLMDRVEALRRAVKNCREESNSKMVEQIKIGQSVMDYLLAP